ncbi:C40 family peptidase [Mariniluteicoccus flavus]
MGFDCSGLVRWAYFRATGVDGLDGTAQMQKNLSAQRGKLVPTNNLVPGDILFFGHGNAHHIGIYLGNGKMINALQSGSPIQVSAVQSDLSGAARY